MAESVTIKDHQIDDITSFLLSGKLFRPNKVEIKPWMEMVSDFEQAFNYSSIQYDDKFEAWGDLGENENGEMMGPFWTASNYKQKNDEFSQVVEPIMEQLELKLATNGRINDDIRAATESDFYMIFKSRFFGGNKSESFLAKLLQGYKTGGWPCGWIEGKFPEGKMVIYMPK